MDNISRITKVLDGLDEDCQKLKKEKQLTEYAEGQRDLAIILRKELNKKGKYIKKFHVIDCHRKRCEMKDVVRYDEDKCPLCRSPAFEKIVIIKCEPKGENL